MAKQNSPIVGLDIGTSSVRVVIAELIEGELEIVGVGEAESRGLRKGVISKPDLTVDSIKRAVESAERMLRIGQRLSIRAERSKQPLPITIVA